MGENRISAGARPVSAPQVDVQKLEKAVGALDPLLEKELTGDWNKVSRFLLTHFTSKDERIHEHVGAAKDAFTAAKKDGIVTADEARDVEAKVTAADRDLRDYADFKRTVADVAGVGLTAAATLVSGGPGIALGSALNVAAHAALEGQGYSWEHAGMDAALGALGTGVAAKIGTSKWVVAGALRAANKIPGVKQAIEAAVRTVAGFGTMAAGDSILNPSGDPLSGLPLTDAHALPAVVPGADRGSFGGLADLQQAHPLWS